MTRPRRVDSTRKFALAVDAARAQRVVLRLYVSGMTAKSLAAISNIKRLCEQCCGDRFELEVVDIYQQPHLAVRDNVVAAPMLVKSAPLPQCKVIGTLGDEADVARRLRILPGGRTRAVDPEARKS